MFTSISWSTYLTTVIVLAVIYYLIILTLYYRKDIFNLMSNREAAKKNKYHEDKPASVKENIANTTIGEDDNTNSEENSMLSTVYALKSALKVLFEKAAANSYPTQELMMSIQLLLRSYPELQRTAFQYAINNYIKTEANSFLTEEITDADLKRAWLD